jgi:hypothetical protein
MSDRISMISTWKSFRNSGILLITQLVRVFPKKIKNDYAKIEKSFLIAIASIIGVSFASGIPNLSMYI